MLSAIVPADLQEESIHACHVFRDLGNPGFIPSQGVPVAVASDSCLATLIRVDLAVFPILFGLRLGAIRSNRPLLRSDWKRLISPVILVLTYCSNG